ncbi:MAG: BrxE family protein, partial [Coriobacteriia bacterium]|nr:BrxE family protein [Coriobacteriia bacterium]
MAADTVAPFGLSALLRLRLAVARYGEMDSARWWNTQGILGARGDAVVERGLPRTHRFAQARIAFAVARSRCKEVFDAPRSVTLWSLPPAIEDEFEDRWQQWLDELPAWDSFFDSISNAPRGDLLGFLADLGLISGEQAARAKTLRRSHEGRAVQLGTFPDPTD